jgi:hypothetical protein
VTLRVGSPEEQGEAIERSFAVHPYLIALLQIAGTANDQLDRTGAAKELLTIYQQLRANRPGEAIRLYERGTVIQQLRETAGADRSQSVTHLDAVSTDFSSISRLLNELQRSLLRENSITERRRSAEQRQLLLSEDLANFLGFPAGTGSQQGFYHSGILAGLPVVPSIPDQIPDLASLKEILQTQAVSPRMEGAEQQVAFATKVATLRSASGSLSEEFAQLQQETSVTTAQLTGQRAALDLSVRNGAGRLLTLFPILLPRSPLEQLIGRAVSLPTS